MMMQDVVGTQCPYCNESIQLLVDCSVPQQEYIEDCQVCCRPIQIVVLIDEDGIPAVSVCAENE